MVDKKPDIGRDVKFDDDGAQVESVGLAAFQGSRTHRILTNYGLLGNTVGLKGFLQSYITPKKSMAVHGAHVDDEKIDREKRDRDRKFLDDWFAFLALREWLGWELAKQAALLRYKNEMFDDLDKQYSSLLKKQDHAESLHTKLKTIQKMNKEVVAEIGFTEEAARRVATLTTLDDLLPEISDVAVRNSFIDSLQERTKHALKSSLEFSEEAHIRPNIENAQKQISFFRNVYNWLRGVQDENEEDDGVSLKHSSKPMLQSTAQAAVAAAMASENDFDFQTYEADFDEEDEKEDASVIPLRDEPY
jgi:hypothetical protein